MLIKTSINPNYRRQFYFYPLIPLAAKTMANNMQVVTSEYHNQA